MTTFKVWLTVGQRRDIANETWRRAEAGQRGASVGELARTHLAQLTRAGGVHEVRRCLSATPPPFPATTVAVRVTLSDADAEGLAALASQLSDDTCAGVTPGSVLAAVLTDACRAASPIG